MQHISDSEFKRDDLCFFRRHDELEALIVRIVAPTGGHVGGRTWQPGGKLSPPAPSHWHYYTVPTISEGAWGQYLTKVPPDFGGQLVTFIEALAHDAGILNHPEKIAGQTARLQGLQNSAEVRFPKNTLVPWTVAVDGEVIAAVNEPFSRKALKELANLVRQQLAA